ncbi:DDE-type integrase/transposase/recombinase [Myxococcota bacterium]
MSEIELPPLVVTLSPEALFRCYVVMLVLGRERLGDTRPEAIALALDEPHPTSTGLLRAVSRRTLYRWLRAYESGGHAALEPASRTVACKALPEPFVEFLRVQKKDDPFVSVPEVIRRARESGTLRADDVIDRVTVYRAAKRLDPPLTSRVAKRYSDMRRFAYPHRMRMVLVDGKHFRAGVGRLKRVALFFIDDWSRRVLAVVVGPSESTRLTLRGLLLVIRHFGLMDILYFDHGPGFDSGDTHAVCRKLGVLFIHGRKRYPEGHGKIEAFNKTAHHDVLRGLLRPEVDADFGSLELCLRHYVEHQYNPRVHESLEGLSPLQRWDRDDRPLRFPADHEALHRRFLVTETRRVSADNVVSVGGVAFEVPRGHARTQLEVRRQTLDDSLWILHEGRLVRLHPVDLAFNAEDRRAAPSSSEPKGEPHPAPITAAAIAFERDFGPLPHLVPSPAPDPTPAATPTPRRSNPTRKR